MASRQEEIQAKRARLAELRRQRDLRTQDPAKWRQSLDAPSYGSSISPGNAGGNRAAVDELVSGLIGLNEDSDALENKPNRRNQSNSPFRVSSQGAHNHLIQPKTQSASTQTLTAVPTTTVFEVAPNPVPRNEYITYNKAVQTDAGASDPLEKDGGLEKGIEEAEKESQHREDWHRNEEVHAKLRREIEAELRNVPYSSKTSLPDARRRHPLRTLTSDELNAVTSSNDFLSFVERSSRVIERALDNDYDLLADYSASHAYDEDFSEQEEGEAGDVYSRPSKNSCTLRQSQRLFDTHKSRRRQISDLQFSPHFPELLLSSHTKNPSAVNDPSGLIMLWNVHARSRPEYTFYSQGTDILSARFSPFHPNLIVGGCYAGQVCLWDTRATSQPAGAPVLKSPASGSHAGHNHPIYCINIVGTPNAHNIITASSDGVVCSWSVDMLTHPQEVLELISPPPSKTDDLAPTCMGFPASDPSFFLVGTEEGKIYPCHRYDRAGAKAGVDTNLVYQGHTAPVMSTQFHPARGPIDLGDLLLTSSVDWSIKVWRVKPAANSSTVAASSGTTSNTASGTSTSKTIGPVLDISRDDLVYDAKWAPHRPSVFACVNGAGDVEIFDLNTDLEVPVAKASPSHSAGELLVKGLNKCAWEEKRGALLATAGLDGSVTLFDVGKGLSGETGPEDWTKFKKAISRVEGGRWS